MQYVAVFEEEKDGVAVSFPDFPGCTSFGANLDEAVDQAHEALAHYIEFYLEEGNELPAPSTKKGILAQSEHQGKKAINVTVAGDGSDFEEIEMVMHRYLLERIEKYCKLHGVSPADFISMAARDAIRDDILEN